MKTLLFHTYRGVGFMMQGNSPFAQSYRKNRPDIWAKVKRRLNLDENGMPKAPNNEPL